MCAESPPSHKGPKPFDRFGESMKIKNGLVSTFHALVAVIEVVTWYANYSFEPFNWQRNLQGGYATPNNVNGDGWFAIGSSFTLGYFIYDTLCMLYYQRYLGNTGSYIHHVAISMALIPGIWLGTGSTYHFLYLFEELSTPALNFKNLYRDSPRAYNFWSVLFVITFYFSRGIYGLIGAVTTYYCLGTYWWMQRDEMNSYYFGFVILVQFVNFSISRGLNIYWMSLIAKYLRSPKKDKVKKAE
jgi:hypothetical protein